eukprot:EG_transcript_22641
MAAGGSRGPSVCVATGALLMALCWTMLPVFTDRLAFRAVVPWRCRQLSSASPVRRSSATFAARSSASTAPGDLGPSPEETLDVIAGGAVRLLQRRRGYRVNLDSELFAHFVGPRLTRGPVIDLGTGTAIIPMLLATLFGHPEVVGLEVQPGLRDLALRNLRLNACDQRVSVVLGDLRRVADAFPPGRAAHVVSNPPYGPRGGTSLSDSEERAIARHEVLCTLPDIVAAASYLLSDGGTFSLVYPAQRLPELTAALQRHRLEPKLLRCLHPRVDRPAKLCLLHAVKGA